ncbi:MAG: hypothetical protein JO069_12765 [Verrucomicrobia bacterium]|nr:hypothetical protein [Verrucomicrobiota bacterium]
MSQDPEEPTLENAVREALALAGVCAVEHRLAPDAEYPDGVPWKYGQRAIQPSHAKNGG